MSTVGSNPNPKPNPKSTTTTSNTADNSKQRLIAIAAVIIVALLGVNAFLLINKFRDKRVKSELTAELTEAEQLKTELEKQYYEALSELEEMRGTNEELNSLIEKQKEELTMSKDQIDALIADGQSLDRARRELRKLKAQVEGYVAEINQLKEENQLLTAENSELSESNSLLQTDLQSSRDQNETLSSEKALLVSEKEVLEADKAYLSKKVDIASVIKVDDIDVSGMKMKKSGKAVKKKYAKNIDQLKVCFNTTSNKVTEAGTEQFLLRIVNPLGETLAIEQAGSGVFTNQETGEQIRFTQIKEHDYNQDVNTLCINWSSDTPLQKGSYDIEVYNKGYLAGSTTFDLK